MKIALMSGAYVNAGDFLIEQRCRELLETNIDNAQIDVFKRNVSYDDRIECLNSYDLIVFGGGPGFQARIYPDKIPFVSNLQDIRARMAVLGWGWKGRSGGSAHIYKKNIFTKDMIRFISHISGQSQHIGCRDWCTVQMLKAQGFENAVMTGCPAWYCMDTIEDLGTQHKKLLNCEKPKIIISDAAFPQNVIYMEMLLRTIREIYPHAYMKVLLHRGITKQNQRCLNDKLKEVLEFETDDISGGGAEIFRQYDACDLHIGFRVHAHIYCLSRGIPSVLINEDARGFGVNDALGIRNLYCDKYLRNQICDYFDFLYHTNMFQYMQSGEAIKFYYAAMQKYIAELNRESK